jgi:hypothetical protein
MFDQFGNAKLEQIYSALSKAPTRETGSVPASVATIRAALESGAITPEQANQYLGGAANLASTRGTSGTRIQTADGTTIDQYVGDVPPALATGAQKDIDSGINTLGAVDLMERTIRKNKGAVGLGGMAQGVAESVYGLADPSKPQSVNMARDRIAQLKQKLIPGLRATMAGIIDQKEETRLNRLLDFEGPLATPDKIFATLDTIRQNASLDIVRKWSRAPVSGRQPLPTGVVETISSPMMAAILVRSGGVDPELIKNLEIETGEADFRHIKELSAVGAIDNKKALDLIGYALEHPDTTDIRKNEIKALINLGVFNLDEYLALEERYKKPTKK